MSHAAAKNEATLAWMKEHDGRAVSTHPDSLACACMIDESLILEAEECLVEIDTEDGNRGHSRISPARRGRCDAQALTRALNARVIKRADTGKFAGMMREALA